MTESSEERDVSTEPSVAAGEPEAPVGPAVEPEPEPAKPRRRRRKAAEPEAASEPKGEKRKREAKPPAKPAPSRRRAKRDPSLPIPVVRAQAKYVRSSARKARLVCDHIRGKN